MTATIQNLFAITLLICAVGVEQMQFDEYQQQLPTELQADFKAIFGDLPESLKEKDDEREDTLQEGV